MAGSSGTTSPDTAGRVGTVPTSVDADRVGAFVGWVALQAPAEGGCREVEYEVGRDEWLERAKNRLQGLEA
ncbi:hypothetical protein [Nocardia brasiliensis]|uniref:hypothetical protein n=1 Tax=Nocardia brasiliensis TaxID=37326 RepID=UPI0011DDBEB9|nr:hypothetical protein [Nocardia brasiliensis]